jgi:ribose transport system substrate-binding protein
MKKALGLALIIVLGIPMVLAISCKKQDQGRGGGEEILVGYAVMGMVDDYWGNQIKGMQAANAASGNKFKLEIADSNYDNQACLENSLSFLSRGAKILVLSTPNPSVGPSIMERANALKVPVVTSDVFVDGTYFLTHDEVKSGELMGEYAGQYFLDNFKGQQAKVVYLCALISADQSNARYEGFRKAFDRKVPNAVYLPQQDAAGQREKGANLMADVITANPDVNIVFGVNDECALGAVSSIEARGLTDKIAVFGLGGIGETAFQALLEPNSCFKATTAFGPFAHGVTMVDQIILPLLEGKTPPKVIYSPLETVDRKNAQKFLDELRRQLRN